MTWLLLETSIFLPSVSFHFSRIFVLKNSFINFSYNFNEPWVTMKVIEMNRNGLGIHT